MALFLAIVKTLSLELAHEACHKTVARLQRSSRTVRFSGITRASRGLLHAARLLGRMVSAEPLLTPCEQWRPPAQRAWFVGQSTDALSHATSCFAFIGCIECGFAETFLKLRFVARSHAFQIDKCEARLIDRRKRETFCVLGARQQLRSRYRHNLHPKSRSEL